MKEQSEEKALADEVSVVKLENIKAGKRDKDCRILGQVGCPCVHVFKRQTEKVWCQTDLPLYSQ